MIDKCIGRNKDIVADFDVANDHGICSDPNIISYRWRVPVYRTDSNSSTDIEILADFHCTENYPAAVPNVHTVANLRIVRKLKSELVPVSY